MSDGCDDDDAVVAWNKSLYTCMSVINCLMSCYHIKSLQNTVYTYNYTIMDTDYPAYHIISHVHPKQDQLAS